MPLGSLLQVWMVKGFIKGCGFDQPLLKSFFKIDGGDLQRLWFNHLVACVKCKIGQEIDCCGGHIFMIQLTVFLQVIYDQSCHLENTFLQVMCF